MASLVVAPSAVRPQHRIVRRTVARQARSGRVVRPNLPAPRGAAERLVANHLDRLGLRWRYERYEFEFAGGGGFRPDFFLPKLSLYLEVTTSARPGVLRRKQSKIAKLADQYHMPCLLIGHDLLGKLECGQISLESLIRQAA